LCSAVLIHFYANDNHKYCQQAKADVFHPQI
jgi:hypothetical protein